MRKSCVLADKDEAADLAHADPLKLSREEVVDLRLSHAQSNFVTGSPDDLEGDLESGPTRFSVCDYEVSLFLGNDTLRLHTAAGRAPRASCALGWPGFEEG